MADIKDDDIIFSAESLAADAVDREPQNAIPHAEVARERNETFPQYAPQTTPTGERGPDADAGDDGYGGTGNDSLFSAEGSEPQDITQDPDVVEFRRAYLKSQDEHAQEELAKSQASGWAAAVAAVQDAQWWKELPKGVPEGIVSSAGLAVMAPDVAHSAAEHGFKSMMRRRIEALDKFDRGERVDPADDPGGLRWASREERDVERKKLQEAIDQYQITPLQQRSLYQMGHGIIDYARSPDRAWAAAKGYEQSVSRQLGTGLGSLAVGLAIGLPAKFITTLPAGVTFVSMGVGEATERAIEWSEKQKKHGLPGLTEEQIVTAGLLGAGPGSTDILPLETLLGRLPLPLPAALKRPLAQAVGRIGGQAFIEGIQEGTQEFLQNLIQQQVYDPTQGLMVNVPGSTALGAGVGGIAEAGKEAGKGALHLASRRGGRSQAPQGGTPQEGEVVPTPPEGVQQPVAPTTGESSEVAPAQGEVHTQPALTVPDKAPGLEIPAEGNDYLDLDLERAPAPKPAPQEGFSLEAPTEQPGQAPSETIPAERPRGISDPAQPGLFDGPPRAAPADREQPLSPEAPVSADAETAPTGEIDPATAQQVQDHYAEAGLDLDLDEAGMADVARIMRDNGVDVPTALDLLGKQREDAEWQKLPLSERIAVTKTDDPTVALAAADPLHVQATHDSLWQLTQARNSAWEFNDADVTAIARYTAEGLSIEEAVSRYGVETYEKDRAAQGAPERVGAGRSGTQAQPEEGSTSGQAASQPGGSGTAAAAADGQGSGGPAAGAADAGLAGPGDRLAGRASGDEPGLPGVGEQDVGSDRTGAPLEASRLARDAGPGPRRGQERRAYLDAKFHAILTGTAPTSEWASITGADPKELADLISTAIRRGQLRVDRFGNVVRTPEAKRPPAASAVATAPVAYTPSLAVPGIVAAYEVRVGRPLSGIVKVAAIEANAKRGLPAFNELLAREDIVRLTREEAVDLANVAGYPVEPTASKAAAFKSLIKRHTDHVAYLEANAPGALNAVPAVSKNADLPELRNRLIAVDDQISETGSTPELLALREQLFGLVRDRMRMRDLLPVEAGESPAGTIAAINQRLDYAASEAAFEESLADVDRRLSEHVPNRDERFYVLAMGGRKAKTADHSTLRAAESMERRGKSPEDIFTATGWWRGNDAHWRFEIDDSKAKLTGDLKKLVKAPKSGMLRLFTGSKTKAPSWAEGPVRVGLNIKLPDLLKHEELFAAYPFLRQMRVSIVLGEGVPLEKQGASLSFRMKDGGIVYSPIKVIARSEAEVLRSLMHELQHYIQEKEGFSSGSNTDNIRGEIAVLPLMLDNPHGGPIYVKGVSFSPGTEAANRSEGGLPYGVDWRERIAGLNRAEEVALLIGDIYETSGGKAPTRAEAREELAKLQAELMSLLRVRTQDYLNSLGEKEANLVMDRLVMTPEQRRAAIPKIYGGLPSGIVTPDFKQAADAVNRSARQTQAIMDRWAETRQLGNDVEVNRFSENTLEFSSGRLGMMAGHAYLDWQNGYGIILHGKESAYLRRRRNGADFEGDDKVISDAMHELADAMEAAVRAMNLVPTADKRLLPGAGALEPRERSNLRLDLALTEDEIAFWRSRDPLFMADKVASEDGDEVIELPMPMPIDLLYAGLDPEIWKARTEDMHNVSSDSQIMMQLLGQIATLNESHPVNELTRIATEAAAAYDRAANSTESKGRAWSDAAQRAWEERNRAVRAMEQAASQLHRQISGIRHNITTGPLRDKLAAWKKAGQDWADADEFRNEAYRRLYDNGAFVREAGQALLGAEGGLLEKQTIEAAITWIRNDLETGWEDSGIPAEGLDDLLLPIIRKHVPGWAAAEAKAEKASADKQRIGDEITAAGGLHPYSLSRVQPARPPELLKAMNPDPQGIRDGKAQREALAQYRPSWRDWIIAKYMKWRDRHEDAESVLGEGVDLDMSDAEYAELGIDKEDMRRALSGWRDAPGVREHALRKAGQPLPSIDKEGLRAKVANERGRPLDRFRVLEDDDVFTLRAFGYEVGRSVDSLGYYSQALEAAKALKQEKGTPEQMRAQLRKAGAKEAELKAAGFDEWLASRSQPGANRAPSITKAEIISFLENNRVEVREAQYGGGSSRNPMTAADMELEGLTQPEGTVGPTKWSRYSIDPENPSYRETVVYLPVRTKGEKIVPRGRGFAIQRADGTFFSNSNGDPLSFVSEEQALYNIQHGAAETRDLNYQSGHFSEPNVIAHIRSSLQMDAKGDLVFLVDELQSDWGQKLREGGVRDEAKIKHLKEQIATARDTHKRDLEAGEAWARSIINGPLPHGGDTLTALDEIYSFPDRYRDEQGPYAGRSLTYSSRIHQSEERLRLLGAELQTAAASTPGHPLVNTTDQWVSTALKRVIAQAVAAGADKIAFTPGAVQVERFNLTQHVSSMRYDPQERRLDFRPAQRGGQAPSFRDVGPEKLPGIIGKEYAQRLLQQPLTPYPGTSGQWHQLDDLGSVEIGGHGMRATYDGIYPRALAKLLNVFDPSIKMEDEGLFSSMDGHAFTSGKFSSEDIGDIADDLGADAAAMVRKAGERGRGAIQFHTFKLTDKVAEGIGLGQSLFALNRNPPEGEDVPSAEVIPLRSLAEREEMARAIMSSPEWVARSEKPKGIRTAEGGDQPNPLLTSKQPGFMTPEWKATRKYTDPTTKEDIVGYDNLINLLARRVMGKVPGGHTARNRQAYIVMGYPGAGKSSITDPLRERDLAAHIVSDDVRPYIPEYLDGANNGGINEEAALISNDVARHFIARGSNLIVETLGTSKGIAVRSAALRQAGYQITLVHVDAPKAVAMERAIKRYREDGRAVLLSSYDADNDSVYRYAKEKGDVDAGTVIHWSEEAQRWQVTEAAEGLGDLGTLLENQPVGRGGNRSVGAPGGAGRSGPSEASLDRNGRPKKGKPKSHLFAKRNFPERGWASPMADWEEAIERHFEIERRRGNPLAQPGALQAVTIGQAILNAATIADAINHPSPGAFGASFLSSAGSYELLKPHVIDIVNIRDKIKAARERGRALVPTKAAVQLVQDIDGIRTYLEGIVPADVGIRIMDRLPNVGTEQNNDRADFDLRTKLMRVALVDGPKAAKIAGFHETVHALREWGRRFNNGLYGILFTQEEWGLLVERAKKVDIENTRMIIRQDGQPDQPMIPLYREMYRSLLQRTGYHGDIEARIEELLDQERVAYLAEAWAEGTDFGKKVNTLLERIWLFIEAVGNWARGNGFQTVDDVFERISTGQIAKRAGEGVAPHRARSVPSLQRALASRAGRAATRSIERNAAVERFTRALDGDATRDTLSAMRADRHTLDALRLHLRSIKHSSGGWGRIRGYGYFASAPTVVSAAMHELGAGTPGWMVGASAALSAASAGTFLAPHYKMVEKKAQYLRDLAHRIADREAQLGALTGRAQEAGIADVDEYARLLAQRAEGSERAAVEISQGPLRHIYDAYLMVTDQEDKRRLAMQIVENGGSLDAGGINAPRPAHVRNIELRTARAIVREDQSEGLRARTYDLHSEAGAATAVIMERGDGSWAATFFDAAPGMQGQLADRLEEIENDLPGRLSPEGFLTSDAYLYWLEANPARVQFHVGAGPLFDNLWVSPRAARFGADLMAAHVEIGTPDEKARREQVRAHLASIVAAMPKEAFAAEDAVDLFTAPEDNREDPDSDAGPMLLLAVGPKARRLGATGTAAHWINRNERIVTDWRPLFAQGLDAVKAMAEQRFNEAIQPEAVAAATRVDLTDYLARQAQNPGQQNEEVRQALQLYPADPESATRQINQHIVEQRNRILDQWNEYLIDINEDYAADPFWRDFVWDGVIHTMRPESPDLPPPLNAAALADVHQEVANDPGNRTFLAMYEEASVAQALNRSKNKVAIGQDKTWVKVPQTASGHPDFRKNVDLIRSLSCKTWCTAGAMADRYIQEGDFWILTEGGQTRMAIRFEGDRVQEIQGPSNNGKIPYAYAKDVQALVDSGEIDVSERTKKEISIAIEKVQTIAEMEKLARVPGQALTVLEELGASVTPVEGGVALHTTTWYGSDFLELSPEARQLVLDQVVELGPRNDLHFSDINSGHLGSFPNVRRITPLATLYGVRETEFDEENGGRGEEEYDLGATYPNLAELPGGLGVHSRAKGVAQLRSLRSVRGGRHIMLPVMRQPDRIVHVGEVDYRASVPTGEPLTEVIADDGRIFRVSLQKDAVGDLNRRFKHWPKPMQEFLQGKTGVDLSDSRFHTLNTLESALNDIYRPSERHMKGFRRLDRLEKRKERAADKLDRAFYKGVHGPALWGQGLRALKTLITPRMRDAVRGMPRPYQSTSAYDIARIFARPDAPSLLLFPFVKRRLTKYLKAVVALSDLRASLRQQVKDATPAPTSVEKSLAEVGIKAVGMRMDTYTVQLSVYDDSLFEITAPDGKPATEAERKAVLNQLAGYDFIADQEAEFLLRAMAYEGKPEREVDKLGYYSAALEAMKAWDQKKGTITQVLAQLKAHGVKPGEIRATTLDKYLEGRLGKSLTEYERDLEAATVSIQESPERLAEVAALREEVKTAKGARKKEVIDRLQALAKERKAEIDAAKSRRNWQPGAEEEVQFSRDELVEFLRANRLEVDELVLGGKAQTRRDQEVAQSREEALEDARQRALEREAEYSANERFHTVSRVNDEAYEEALSEAVGNYDVRELVEGDMDYDPEEDRWGVFRKGEHLGTTEQMNLFGETPSYISQYKWTRLGDASLGGYQRAYGIENWYDDEGEAQDAVREHVEAEDVDASDYERWYIIEAGGEREDYQIEHYGGAGFESESAANDAIIERANEDAQYYVDEMSDEDLLEHYSDWEEPEEDEDSDNDDVDALGPQEEVHGRTKWGNYTARVNGSGEGLSNPTYVERAVFMPQLPRQKQIAARMAEIKARRDAIVAENHAPGGELDGNADEYGVLGREEDALRREERGIRTSAFDAAHFERKNITGHYQRTINMTPAGPLPTDPGMVAKAREYLGRNAPSVIRPDSTDFFIVDTARDFGMSIEGRAPQRKAMMVHQIQSDWAQKLRDARRDAWAEKLFGAESEIGKAAKAEAAAARQIADEQLAAALTEGKAFLAEHDQTSLEAATDARTAEYRLGRIHDLSAREVDGSPYLMVRGVVRLLDQATSRAEFELMLKNDGEAYGYLMEHHPELNDNERWASVVTEDIYSKNPIGMAAHALAMKIGAARRAQNDASEALVRLDRKREFSDLDKDQRKQVSKAIQDEANKGERGAMGVREAGQLEKLEDEIADADQAMRDASTEAIALIETLIGPTAAQAVRDRDNPTDYAKALDEDSSRGIPLMETQYRALYESPDRIRIRDAYRAAAERMRLKRAELKAAQAALPSHPMVDTTDQWLRTTLRRVIRDAVVNGVDIITTPPGKFVLSYNPGVEAGMEGFYDTIVVPTLLNVLQGYDPSIQAVERTAVNSTINGRPFENPRITGEQVEFYAFPITDKVRQEILGGQRLMALGFGRGSNTQPSVPYTPPNQRAVRGVSEIVEALKSQLGMTSTVGRYRMTVTDRRAGRSWRLNPFRGRRDGGQYFEGAARVRIGNDIDAIARAGGQHLLASMRGVIAPFLQTHAEELTEIPVANRPLPALNPTGFSGLEIDADTQGALIQAAQHFRTWRTLTASPNADREQVRRTGLEAAIQIRKLTRRLGQRVAVALLDDLVGNAGKPNSGAIGQTQYRQVASGVSSGIDPAAIPGYVAQRYSATGTPQARAARPQPTPAELEAAFIDFFQRMVLQAERYTSQDPVRRDMPGTFHAFRELMSAHNPELLESIDGLDIFTASEDYRAYRLATAWERGVADSATLRETTLWEEIKSHWRSSNRADGLLQWFSHIGSTGYFALAEAGRRVVPGGFSDVSFAVFDKTNPILKVTQQLLSLADQAGVRDANGRPIVLRGRQNAHKIARMMAGAHGVGHQWITHGVPDYDGIHPVGASLREALVEAMGGTARFQWNDEAMTRFGVYLEARRAIGEWPRFLAGEIGQPTRRSLEENQRIVVDAEAANPNYRSAAQKVYDWQHRLLTLEYRAGKWSDEAYRALTARKAFYVPYIRDIEQDPKGSPPEIRKVASRFTASKRFKGHDSDIVNPIEAMVKRAYQTAAAVQFNDMVKAMAELSDRVGPTAARFVERVDKAAVMTANAATFDRLKQQAIDMGMDPADAHAILLDAETNFTDTDVHVLFQPTDFGAKRPPMLPLWENGERKLVRFNDPVMGRRLYDAMNAVGRPVANVLNNALLNVLVVKPAAILRAGVTMHPAFILSNMVGDMLATWVRTGATPVVTQARGLHHLLSTNPTYARVLRSVGIQPSDFARIYTQVGGISGGQNVAALNAVSRNYEVTELRRDGWRAWDARAVGGFGAALAGGFLGGTFGGPIGATLGASVGLMAGRIVLGKGAHMVFAQMTELSETVTRLGVASMAMQRAKKLDPSISDVDAIREAAFTARNVLDFDRGGAYLGPIIKLIPFLNSALQGVSGAYRQGLVLDGERGKMNLRNAGLFLRHQLTGTGGAALRARVSENDIQALKEGGRMWVNMMILAFVSIAIALLFKDDDEVKDATKEVRNTHWVIRLPNVGIMRIKKPFELATFSNIAEAAFNWWVQKDPRIIKPILEGIWEVHQPPMVPAIGTLAVGLRTGIDPRTGRPIEPESTDRRSPQYRYSAYASAFAREWATQLAKVGINVSPAMIDWTLQAELAYWGREIKVTSDYFYGHRGAPKWTDYPVLGTIVNRFTVDPSRSSDSVNEFWKAMGQGRGEYDRAAADYDFHLQSGNPLSTASFLAGLQKDERIYAVLQKHGSTREKESHPLNRAGIVLRINAAMRREMADPGGLIATKSVTDAQGETVVRRGGSIQMTPKEQATVDDIVGRLSAIEAWNALHSMGREGWGNRETRDPQPILDELRAASPAAYGEMMHRRSGKKVGTFEADKARWATTSAKVERIIDEQDMLGLKDPAMRTIPSAWNRVWRKRKGPARRMEVPGQGDEGYATDEPNYPENSDSSQPAETQP